jgi:hypothetical protein
MPCSLTSAKIQEPPTPEVFAMPFLATSLGREAETGAIDLYSGALWFHTSFLFDIFINGSP